MTSCQCFSDSEFSIGETREALKFRLPPRSKASSKSGGVKLQKESVKKRKKGTNLTEDENEEDRRAQKKLKKAAKKARQEAETAGHIKSIGSLPASAPKKRGRPLKSKDGSTTKITPSHSFDASVFVSIEQSPEVVRGKTYRTDKLVPKKPRIEGPFTLTKSMGWSQFLDEIADCIDIDKENIKLDGMTWAFQRQKEPLPLSTEQGFKTMREQIKTKEHSAATVVFVYHPICRNRKAGHRGHGGIGENNNEENAPNMNHVFREDDAGRWGKKVKKAITASK